MVRRVVLDIPGESNPRTLELADGDICVVGRHPALNGDAAAGARTVPVASPSVSANHIKVSRSGGDLLLVDERSRNGTWVRLPANDPVVVRSEQEIVIRLGAGSRPEPAEEAPADASWTGAADFHFGVAQAVDDWFKEQHVPARVSTLPRGETTTRESPDLIPLANGFILSVVPRRTMDHRWERMAGTLWTYASAQNRVFTAEEHTRGEGMVLVSPVMRAVHRAVVEAAQRGVRVLLVGETGVGKDGLARCYHRNSGRSGGFLSKNCSTLNKEHLSFELFGAEKGSYTGSTQTVIGAVERCHGGTLFLDEIGDLPAEVQAMLLTFLDNGEYERFGAKQVRKADVRIVSATNRDLRSAVAGHTFREDLWYRIAGQVIEVPALCKRPEDVEAFLQLTRLPTGRSVHDVLTPAAQQMLLKYRWEGNFRELKNFVDRVPASATAASIDVPACDLILQSNPNARRSTGPLRPVAASESPIDDIAMIATMARDAFRSDLAHDMVGWDDVKQFVESYLKPLLFAALSGVSEGRHEDADIASIARAIDADRGTVRKHLARFLERFGAGALERK